MDIETMKFAFQILQFVLTGGIGIYVYLSGRDKVTNERIGKLEEDLDNKLDGQGERIATLEAIGKNAIDHKDVAKVYESLNALAATVNQLVGEHRSQGDMLKLIFNQMTTKGSK